MQQETQPTDTINILDLLKDGRHFAERRGNMVHVIDSLSGNSIVVYASDHINSTPTDLIKVDTPKGTHWIQRGVNPALMAVPEVTYSPLIIDLICQKIAEGGNLTSICREPDMPSYNLLCRWKRHNPEIEEALNSARRDRAEFHRDAAMEEARLAQSRDPLGAAQLRVDAHKWAASVDHEKYNPKTKVEATISAPTQIVVYTGIDRAPEREVKDASKEG